MARSISFEEFRGNLTEQDLNNLVRIARKRRTIYIIGWLISFALIIFIDQITWAIFKQEIPYVGFVTIPLLGTFASLATYTHNMVCYVKSRGRRKHGNALVVLLGTVVCGVVIGVVITILLDIIAPFGVLGWKKAGIYKDRRR